MFRGSAGCLDCAAVAGLARVASAWPFEKLQQNRVPRTVKVQTLRAEKMARMQYSVRSGSPEIHHRLDEPAYRDSVHKPQERSFAPRQPASDSRYLDPTL